MYIKIKVVAGAKKESIVHKKNDEFQISVTQKAQMNMANKRVIEVVEGYYGLGKGGVRMISGHHSPGKILSIPDGSEQA